MTNLGEDLKKVMLAGIGAVATTAEKSKELVDQFVKKGELTVEQGKVLNEELKHNFKQKVKDNVTVKVVKPAETEDILDRLDDMSEEDLAAIREKLAALDKEKPAEAPEAE